MSKWKWLLRIASLLIMLGFFMPAVLVSCNAGFVEPIKSFSLAEIADYVDVPILYILPIFSIVAIVLSFLQDKSGSGAAGLLWGQLAAIVIQLLTLVITIVSMISEVRNNTYNIVKVTPTFGTFFIIGSAALYLFSWISQKRNFSVPKVGPPAYSEVLIQDRESPSINGPQSPPYLPDQVVRAPIEQLPGQPYLIVLAGSYPSRQIQISNDSFSMGRTSTNQVHLEDNTVSRNHAVFRYSQGMWFLQDKESSGGTYVNGLRTDAIKLNDGDEIGIGPYRFQFRINQER